MALFVLLRSSVGRGCTIGSNGFAVGFVRACFGTCLGSMLGACSAPLSNALRYGLMHGTVVKMILRCKTTWVMMTTSIFEYVQFLLSSASLMNLRRMRVGGMTLCSVSNVTYSPNPGVGCLQESHGEQRQYKCLWPPRHPQAPTQRNRRTNVRKIKQSIHNRNPHPGMILQHPATSAHQASKPKQQTHNINAPL